MHVKPKALIVDCNQGDDNMGVPAMQEMLAEIGFDVVTVDAFAAPEKLPADVAELAFVGFSGGRGDPAQAEGKDRGQWNVETASFADRIMAHDGAFPDQPVYVQFICLSHQNFHRHNRLAETGERPGAKRKLGVQAETLADGTAIWTMANNGFQVHDNEQCHDVKLHGMTLNKTSICAENKAIVATEIVNTAGTVVGRSAQYHVEATAETVHWLLTSDDAKAKGFQAKVAELHGDDAVATQLEHVMEIQGEHDRFRAFAKTAYDATIARQEAPRIAVLAERLTPAA